MVCDGAGIWTSLDVTGLHNLDVDEYVRAQLLLAAVSDHNSLHVHGPVLH